MSKNNKESVHNLNENELNEIFNYIIELTKKCGIVMKEGYFLANKQVTHKDNKNYDLVTEYDGRVEEMLISGILMKYPNHKIIAEETSARNNMTPDLTNEPTWIIDPIDGTSNFIHGFPITAISIGFVCQKQILIGIVYNPILENLFTAQLNKGAYCNNERIYVSKINNLKDSLIGHEVSLASCENIRDKNLKRVEIIVSRAHGIRSLGCAALSLSYVAQGSIDAYHVDDLKPWDIVAGALLIREAGGFVFGSDGGEYNIMKPDVVVGGTEELCREIIELFKK